MYNKVDTYLFIRTDIGLKPIVHFTKTAIKVDYMYIFYLIRLFNLNPIFSKHITVNWLDSGVGGAHSYKKKQKKKNLVSNFANEHPRGLPTFTLC